MHISTMLKDGIDGSMSSKRVVTVLAFTLCTVAFLANLFFGMTIEKFIFDSMSYIAMAGLGATAAEKFTSAERVRVEQHYERQREQSQLSSGPRGRRIPTQQDPLI